MRQASLEFVDQLPETQLKAIFNAFIKRRVERFRKRPQKTRAQAAAVSTANFRDSTTDVYKTQFYKVVNNLHALRGKTLLDCDVDDFYVAICQEGGGGGFNRTKDKTHAVDGYHVKEWPMNVHDRMSANDEDAVPKKSDIILSTTISRYVSLFADVFESMVIDKLRHNNPAKLLRAAAEPYSEFTSFFPAEQEQQFMVALQKYTDATTDWMRRRDRALFVIMLGAGLRPSEAVALTIGDLIWHNAELASTARISVRVPSFNGIYEPRSVALEPWACPHLFQWAAERKDIMANYGLGHHPKDLLFPQWGRVEPLDTNTVYCSMQTVIKLFLASEVAALAHIKGPNTLRNTYIARALHRVESHSSIIEKVGLRDTKALRRYLALRYCQSDEKAA